MYLSHSGFEKAEACMYAYWHVYPNKTPYGVPDDRLGSIFGSAIGTIFEQFYKERLWRQPNTLTVLQARVEAVVDETLYMATQPKKGKPGGVLLWRGEGEGHNPKALYGSREELIRDTQFCIQNGLRTIKAELLISQNPKTEMKLHTIVEGHELGGYADFVMDQVKTGLTLILDGKGSRRREKYVKKDQLTWYCLLYSEKFGRLPDRTAFIYWRFEPPVGIDWLDPTQGDVDRLKHRVLSRISKIEKALAKLPPNSPLKVVQEYFRPNATIQNCMFCPYATEALCPKGFEKKESLRKRDAQRV